MRLIQIEVGLMRIFNDAAGLGLTVTDLPVTHAHHVRIEAP